MANPNVTFEDVVLTLSEKYPKRNIRLSGTMVMVDGEIKFNAEGYNFLYNVMRLTRLLEDELI